MPGPGSRSAWATFLKLMSDNFFSCILQRYEFRPGFHKTRSTIVYLEIYFVFLQTTPRIRLTKIKTSISMANQKGAEQQESLGTAMNKTELFLERNGRKVTYVFVGLLVLAALVYGYRALISQPRAKQAAEMIAEAQNRFEAENPDFELALNGDANGAGFLEVAEQYGSTPSGTLAERRQRLHRTALPAQGGSGGEGAGQRGEGGRIFREDHRVLPGLDGGARCGEVPRHDETITSGTSVRNRFRTDGTRSQLRHHGDEKPQFIPDRHSAAFGRRHEVRHRRGGMEP